MNRVINFSGSTPFFAWPLRCPCSRCPQKYTALDAGTMRTILRRLVRGAGVLFCVVSAAAAEETPEQRIARANWGGWAEEEGFLNGTTYSVIVVASNPKPSNLFRDKQRVRAFARTSEGGGVASVQFASPTQQHPLLAAGVGPPFGVAHPHGVDKRVRIIYVSDLHFPQPNQESHLRAACDDEDETTVMVITSESCGRITLPGGVPPTCAANIVYTYPFNDNRAAPQAYKPLGTINSFPFVASDEVAAATDRSRFFSLQVTPRSQRRKDVIAYVEQYARLHPDVPNRTQGPDMNSTEWQALLLDTTFTICPGGHNAETYRMWEALEAGSIPIVSKLDYADPVYFVEAGKTCGKGDTAWNTVADSPFAMQASVDTWQGLPALLDRLRSEPDEYIQRLQESCMAWYEARMRRTYASLLNMGEGYDMFPQLGPMFGLPYNVRLTTSSRLEESDSGSTSSPGVNLRLWVELLCISCCGLVYVVRATKRLVPTGTRCFTLSSTLFAEPVAGA